MEQEYLDSLKHSTPTIKEFNEKFIDADDELKEISKKLKASSKYLSDVEPDRIKFFYTNKPKKKGDTFEIFNLMLRNELEKTIEESYDYILTVYYAVWATLDPIQKVISLDKALCGVDFGKGDEVKLGKASPDCSEFKNNMKQYGATKVMDTSEIITLACRRIADEEKEAKRQAAADKAAKKKGNNVPQAQVEQV